MYQTLLRIPLTTLNLGECNYNKCFENNEGDTYEKFEPWNRSRWNQDPRDSRRRKIQNNLK